MAIHTPGPQEFGVATAKLNGQDWEASVYPNLDLLADGYVRLSFYTETEQGYLRDAVRTAMYDTTNQTLTTVEVIDSLWVPNKLIGDYRSRIDGGDVPGGMASIDEARQSSTVSYLYDPATNSLSGTFDLYFQFGNGEIFDLTEGAFEVRLEN